MTQQEIEQKQTFIAIALWSAFILINIIIPIVPMLINHFFIKPIIELLTPKAAKDSVKE